MSNRVRSSTTIAILSTIVSVTVPIAAATAQSFTVQSYSIGGEGAHDYITAEPGTGRVFISRGTHVMVVDGNSGRLLGDILDTPRVHGIALVPKWNHGFTTNSGDSTLTIFDLTTLAVVRKVATKTGGLDGIMYDESTDRIILTNHSRPIGTATAVNAETGEIVAVAELEDNAPEGAASDGMGRLFVNNESKNTVQVLDSKSLKILASWPIAPCDGPTGIALDRATNRLFSGCSGTSVVTDVTTGKVVATLANGDGVDALGYDASEQLIYLPAGRDGNVTIVKQDGANTYHVLTTVKTMPGTKTIAVDPVRHVAYAVALEYGPPPAGTAASGSGRGPTRGPVVGAKLFVISH